MSCISSVDGIKLWLLASLVNYVPILLVTCQLSRDVIVYEEDSKCDWCVSLRFLSQWKRSFIISQTAVVSVAWVRPTQYVLC